LNLLWRWPRKTAPGWALIDAINKEGEVADYQWVHSTKADLYRRLEQIPEALEAYGRALE
jgi:predicted RNA polymerase sigma factor